MTPSEAEALNRFVVAMESIAHSLTLIAWEMGATKKDKIRSRGQVHDRSF